MEKLKLNGKMTHSNLFVLDYIFHPSFDAIYSLFQLKFNQNSFQWKFYCVHVKHSNENEKKVAV